MVCPLCKIHMASTWKYPAANHGCLSIPYFLRVVFKQLYQHDLVLHPHQVLAQTLPWSWAERLVHYAVNISLVVRVEPVRVKLERISPVLGVPGKTSLNRWSLVSLAFTRYVLTEGIITFIPLGITKLSPGIFQAFVHSLAVWGTIPLLNPSEITWYIIYLTK